MNRAGLLNFWYYDEEIFNFSNGKLLLRGSNGSGKSVTMQSFLPVLLDGRTSPDRLDPFGSKARKMEDYLLGEKEIVNRDERTGYLFIEFKREHTEQYLTIGIGLQAKRNKQMKFWGFVINDNRRIAIDFHLYKLERSAGEEHKLPLSRVELENLLQDGGHVVQTKSEYTKLVNKYLFNFETIEAYEDLIKLLIQLRSPKLSKDFKPTVIYEILEAALPPLSDEDLRHLSDTIEQMDQTKQQIEQLDREAVAITSLNKFYQTYNEYILAEQAHEYLQAEKRLAKEQENEQETKLKQEQLINEIEQLEVDRKELELKKSTYMAQEKRLRSHKIWNLEEERAEIENKLTQETAIHRRKTDQLQTRRNREHNLRIDLQKLETTIASQEKDIKDKLTDLVNDAEEAAFTESHHINEQDFKRHGQATFDFSLWKKEAGNHLSNLEWIEEKLREFEALKEKYQEKNKQLADENKKLDDALYQEQEWVRLFEEDKEIKLNEIHTWVNETSWLDIPDEVMQETARALQSLYEDTSYETIKEPFRQATYQYEQSQREKLSELRFMQNQLIEELEAKEAELAEWKSKKDPEPATDPLTKEARQQLTEMGIAYSPLYAAVEFHDDVEASLQKRIEAALIDSGMLNALIVEKNIEIKHDKVLTADPQMMAYTLANYLKPDLDSNCKLPTSLVDDILRSILIDESDETHFSVDEQGNYKIGLLKGHALPVENVRYIGKNARKRYQAEQIERIQEEIYALQNEKQSLDSRIEQIETAIKQASTRLAAFPPDKDLAESFNQIKDVRLTINHHNGQIAILTTAIQTIYADYTTIKRTIDEKTRSYNLEVSLSSFQEAIVVMKRYEKDLSETEKSHIQYINFSLQYQDKQDQLRELTEEILEIQGDINIAEDLIKGLEGNLKQIKLELEKHGETDIRKQINEVQDMLKEIDHALDKTKEKLPVKRTERKQIDEQLTHVRQTVQFWLHLKETWEKSFLSELHREFVLTRNDQPAHEAARKVTNEFGHLLKEKERPKLLEQLTKEYYKQHGDLMEYRLNSFSALYQTPEWMNNETSDEQKLHIDNWKQKMSRQLIELNHLGKQMSPSMLKQQIEMEQARQESFLDDQDRALYEEILFHTVGQKLRARIRRAEQWVKQMKKLMESRDTSSGLSFSIQWKPRTADSETEMDTVDLVHLLRQDAKLLKETDRDKIIMHFRSKIEKAKEVAENENENELQTFLQVLKEVLDYRKWFSFVLYFRREGENKRELTNNQFYKFSGGEKAMAMYIPLFTACYSRYLEADPEAPYIISLDEAFAGVDENNIREMFEIVEQLGFDYMMNSQVLWGDYDTISELSIYELLRPKNADFVGVMGYYWDGNKRIELDKIETDEESDMKVTQ